MTIEQMKCNGKLEFDVIVSGNYQRRVDRGVLIEVTDESVSTHIGCSKEDLFDVFLAILSFIKENGLEEECTEYLCGGEDEESEDAVL